MLARERNACAARQDAPVKIPSPTAMLERLRAIPAARPLLDRLADRPEVYVVGGAVRDLLLGRGPAELDLVVDGDPVAVAQRLGGELRLHDRFGTCTVRLDGHRYDIARARTETYSHPGALPDVQAATLEEDLARRDFTVNAIALALGGGHAGELRAVAGAFDDLDARLLRVLHERSFRDDPTRLLRLARYAGRLGFAIETRTLELGREAVVGRALDTVSGPRVGAELRLAAREPARLAVFATMRGLGLDEAIHPGFGITEHELAVDALALLPPDGRPDLLALALASTGIDAPPLRALLHRLAFQAAEREAIVAAATRARELGRALARAKRPSEIAAAAAGAAPELVAMAGAAVPGARGAAFDWLTRLRHVRLQIDGGDLLRAGIPEGPAIGAGLRAALAAKLDGRAAGREAELREALDAAG